MRQLEFNLITKSGTEKKVFDIDKVCVIGLTGRNIEKTKEHIKELAAMGIPSPENVPVIYYVGTGMLTQDHEITVIGGQTSGEVEFIILKRGEKIYIGMGSDHTDRGLEATSITKSKQICEKVCSQTLWDYDEIKGHWDELEMTSWQIVDGKEVLYQKGKAGDILVINDLIAACLKEIPTVEDCILFSGTVPTVNGFFYGEGFKCLIEDKLLKRKLEFTYKLRIYDDFL